MICVNIRVPFRWSKSSEKSDKNELNTLHQPIFPKTEGDFCAQFLINKSELLYD